MADRRANRYTAFVSPRYTEAERRQIGLLIVNYIVQRTKDGLGIGKKPFKSNYSKAYVNSPDFKIAGKTRGNVNLTLTGDMLDSVEVLDISIVGKIVIGFVEDNESDKSVFLEEKGYNFLGLTEKELNSILSEFGQPSQSELPNDISTTLVQSFVRGLFGR